MTGAASPRRTLSAWVALLLLGGVGAGLFALDLATPLGVADGIGYAPLLIATYWLNGRRPTLVAALIYTSLIIAGHFLGVGGVGQAAIVNRIVALVSLWLVAAIIVEHKAPQFRAGGSRAGQGLAWLLRLLRLLRFHPVRASDARLAAIERNVWVVAHLYVEAYGDDALQQARRRGAQLLDAGDRVGHATWDAIAAAVTVLTPMASDAGRS